MNAKKTAFFFIVACSSLLGNSSSQPQNPTPTVACSPLQEKRSIAIVIRNPQAALVCKRLLEKGSTDQLRREAIAALDLPRCNSELFPCVDAMESLLTKLVELKKIQQLSHVSISPLKLKKGVALTGFIQSPDYEDTIYGIMGTTACVTYVVSSLSKHKLPKERIERAIARHKKTEKLNSKKGTK